MFLIVLFSLLILAIFRSVHFSLVFLYSTLCEYYLFIISTRISLFLLNKHLSKAKQLVRIEKTCSQLVLLHSTFLHSTLTNVLVVGKDGLLQNRERQAVIEEVLYLMTQIRNNSDRSTSHLVEGGLGKLVSRRAEQGSLADFAELRGDVVRAVTLHVRTDHSFQTLRMDSYEHTSTTIFFSFNSAAREREKKLTKALEAE